jgi:hypothetical protein
MKNGVFWDVTLCGSCTRDTRRNTPEHTILRNGLIFVHCGTYVSALQILHWFMSVNSGPSEMLYGLRFDLIVTDRL